MATSPIGPSSVRVRSSAPPEDVEALAPADAASDADAPAAPTGPVDSFDAKPVTGADSAPAPAPAAAPLKSTSMKDDPTLAQVADGSATLEKGAKGDSVKHFQQALVDAGYPLRRFGTDGDFGGETKVALTKFQTDHQLPPTGTLDAGTIAALDTAAASKVRYPEYDRMMKDGVLDTTIGIGFDEDGNDISQRKELVQGLADRGFAPLDVAKASDDDLKKLGLDPARIDRNATYFTKVFQHDGKDVRALVKLVDRNSPNAKQEFADGMANSSLVIYSGHARYGSGPDFDDIHSKNGNFVIGQPYEKGHVTIGENDLAKTKMTDKYQMMFFDGCTTRHYLHNLRTIPKNKDDSNLDIIASNKELPWTTGNSDVFAVLDGVMNNGSVDDMKKKLETNNGVGFTADGFKNNSYHPN